MIGACVAVGFGALAMVIMGMGTRLPAERRRKKFDLAPEWYGVTVPGRHRLVTEPADWQAY